MMFKKVYMAMAVMALGLAGMSAQAAVEVGAAAPDIEAVDVLSGETFKLSDLKGQTVVLEWTNHECPFVVKHYDTGNMQDAQKKALAQENVKWVSIVSSAPGRQGHVDAEKAAMVVKEKNASPSYKLLDESGEIGKAYGAMTTPHMFVIGADGAVAYAGAIDDNSSPSPKTVEGAKNYVLAALDDISAGNSVAVPQTRPYGCSVKY